MKTVCGVSICAQTQSARTSVHATMGTLSTTTACPVMVGVQCFTYVSNYTRMCPYSKLTIYLYSQFQFICVLHTRKF